MDSDNGAERVTAPVDPMLEPPLPSAVFDQPSVKEREAREKVAPHLLNVVAQRAQRDGGFDVIAVDDRRIEIEPEGQIQGWDVDALSRGRVSGLRVREPECGSVQQCKVPSEFEIVVRRT